MSMLYPEEIEDMNSNEFAGLTEEQIEDKQKE